MAGEMSTLSNSATDIFFVQLLLKHSPKVNSLINVPHWFLMLKRIMALKVVGHMH